MNVSANVHCVHAGLLSLNSDKYTLRKEKKGQEILHWYKKCMDQVHFLEKRIIENNKIDAHFKSG